MNFKVGDIVRSIGGTPHSLHIVTFTPGGGGRNEVIWIKPHNEWWKSDVVYARYFRLATELEIIRGRLLGEI